MSDVIDRPIFSEGQILAAADLQGSQDHATDQLARHERTLHSWGIASGLALTTQHRSTADTPPRPYVDVTLAMGMAVDGTGREIVVPADTRIAEADFAQSNFSLGAAISAWFPVFLIGRDVPATSAAPGVFCGAAAGSHTQEFYDIEFGHPGDAARLDEQIVPTIATGPGNGAWRVLVGFVQWDASIPGGKFTDAKAFDDQGTTLRYAGVRADRVTARGSTLTLSLPTAAPDGKFVFSVLGAAGAATPVLTIAANGDVTATGKLQGSSPGSLPGSVRIQSGAARHGIVLPLPAGVTEAMVAPGKGVVHVHLTPRIPAAPPGAVTGHFWIGAPIECGVDAQRRLRCLLRFVDFSVAPPKHQDVPGVADYLIVVAITPAGGQP